MKQIPLSTNKLYKNSGKYFAIVDDEDFEFLNQYKWHVLIVRTGNCYAVRNYCTDKGSRAHEHMHRVIMGCKKGDGKTIDHKDRNGLNCQKSNLRISTISQNNSNKKSHKGSTSKYLGVSVSNRTFKRGIKTYTYNRFVAELQKNGKVMYKKIFKNEIDAAIGYNEAAKIHHGEFANLNIIEL